MKNFKKGQLVTYIQSVDDRGTFFFRQAEVISCGNKVMALRDTVTGENMGNHFRPTLGGDYGGTFPQLSNEEAVSTATEIAYVYTADQAGRFLKSMKEDQYGKAYTDCMREKLAELHPPEILEYNTWMASL